MLKAKTEEAGSLSKSDCQKLQKRYVQCGAVEGSVRNLVKASNLRASKVGQFFRTKPSHIKFTVAKRKFRQIKAFAGFKNEI